MKFFAKIQSVDLDLQRVTLHITTAESGVTEWELRDLARLLVARRDVVLDSAPPDPEDEHHPNCDVYDFDPDVQLGSDKPCSCKDLLRVEGQNGREGETPKPRGTTGLADPGAMSAASTSGGAEPDKAPSSARPSAREGVAADSNTTPARGPEEAGTYLGVDRSVPVKPWLDWPKDLQERCANVHRLLNEYWFGDAETSERAMRALVGGGDDV